MSTGETYRLEAQAVGGKYFTLIEYRGGTEAQWGAACDLRDTLRDLGLYVITTVEPAALVQGEKK